MTFRARISVIDCAAHIATLDTQRDGRLAWTFSSEDGKEIWPSAWSYPTTGAAVRSLEFDASESGADLEWMQAGVAV